MSRALQYPPIPAPGVRGSTVRQPPGHNEKELIKDAQEEINRRIGLDRATFLEPGETERDLCSYFRPDRSTSERHKYYAEPYNDPNSKWQPQVSPDTHPPP